MIRDNIKDEKYFENYLNNLYTRIDRFEGLTKKVVDERGYEDKGAQNGLFTLQGFYLNAIKALFSFGASKTDIENYFKKFINLSYDFKHPLTYNLILDGVSLGILLDVNDEYFNKLVELIRKSDLNDYLIDFLLSKKVNWDKQAKDFKFPEPYLSLEQVISLATSGEKEKAVEKLKFYLDKEWYKGHSDTGWYDNHKSKHDTYAGYWSWESGALVQVLGLDDSSLKDQQYYPYDMVHWND